MKKKKEGTGKIKIELNDNISLSPPDPSLLDPVRLL
jgi:hypothetical protein